MTDIGWEDITIQHSTGLANHWMVKSPRFFVVCRAVRAVQQLKSPQDNAGILYGWTEDTRTGRKFSRMKARVFIQDLLELGWERPLMLGAKVSNGVDFLGLTVQHVEMFKACRILAEKSGKTPSKLPFYAISMEVKAGDKFVTRGKEPGKQKKVFPMVLNAPPNPTEEANLKAAGEYIKSHWLKKDWIPLIEALVPDTVRWSQQKIATEREDSEAGEPIDDAPRSQRPQGRRYEGEDVL
jgi:hypothetical protein